LLVRQKVLISVCELVDVKVASLVEWMDGVLVGCSVATTAQLKVKLKAPQLVARLEVMMVTAMVLAMEIHSVDQ
jgi:hypothetical protein